MSIGEGVGIERDLSANSDKGFDFALERVLGSCFL